MTHLFVEGDPYLESDAVFGVKNSLVVDFKRNDSEAEAKKVGLKAPFLDGELRLRAEARRHGEAAEGDLGRRRGACLRPPA